MKLVCKSNEMERTSLGGRRVRTNLNEFHEMRRNGEKFSWDLKVLKIPRDEEILWDFLPINANAATISPFTLGGASEAPPLRGRVKRKRLDPSLELYFEKAVKCYHLLLWGPFIRKKEIVLLVGVLPSPSLAWFGNFFFGHFLRMWRHMDSVWYE